MDAEATHRDELVAEVDLALAALRRVILKAIDRPQIKPATVHFHQLKTAVPSPTPSLPPQIFRANVAAAEGIEIDFDSCVIVFRGQTVTASKRQIQLAAVLAKESPNFIKNAEATRRAWPDLQESSRATSIPSSIRALSRVIAPLGLKAERIYGRGCRLFAIESQAA